MLGHTRQRAQDDQGEVGREGRKERQAEPDSKGTQPIMKAIPIFSPEKPQAQRGVRGAKKERSLDLKPRDHLQSLPPGHTAGCLSGRN